MLRFIVRSIIGPVGRFLSHFVFKINIEGKENLPKSGPLLIISNHFTWFEAPLLIGHLPFAPSFVAATELKRFWWFRLGAYAYDLVPIWRGQVDRTAIKKASDLLASGRAVGIFPEGGVNPAIQEAVARGERIDTAEGHLVRQPAELISARPGAAFLAVRNKVPILPVAFIGTENTLENLAKWRRTPITMRIGPVFGPLAVDPQLKGQEKREATDALGDVMMTQLAKLFPPEYRGVYQEKVTEQT